jgi:hypothetical protein
MIDQVIQTVKEIHMDQVIHQDHQEIHTSVRTIGASSIRGSN